MSTKAQPILRKARDPGKGVESGIEGQDPLDPMLLHHGEMHRIACGQLVVSQDNSLRAFHIFLINRQHLIHNRKQCVESQLDCVPAVDGNVTVQNFLEHLGIGDQWLAVRDQPFENSLCVGLVHVRRADKIHWDIRIDQNHG